MARQTVRKFKATASPPTDSNPEAWTATATHEKFMLTTVWRVVGGRPEPVSILVERTDGSGVAGNRIRQLPLGEMVEASRRVMESTAQLQAAAQEQLMGRPRLAARTRRDWVGPHRGRSTSPATLEQVAEVYKQAWTDHESVNKAVRKAFGLTESGAGKRIMSARKAGLLKGVGPR